MCLWDAVTSTGSATASCRSEPSVALAPPDLLVDSEGQPLGGGVMLWADSMCLQSQALTLTAATPADGTA